jgi:hypothetical protein
MSQFENNNINTRNSIDAVDSYVKSNEHPMFLALNSNEERSKLFAEGFEERFCVGKEFNSIDHLRDEAFSFGKLHNVNITTLTSSLKEGRITLHCKHGSVYRSAKKTTDVLVGTDKSRATSTSRSQCPMVIVARRNKSDLIVIRKSVSAHDHPLAQDVRTYAAFRKMEPHQMETAITLLKKHTPSAVLKVCFYFSKNYHKIKITLCFRYTI